MQAPVGPEPELANSSVTCSVSTQVKAATAQVWKQNGHLVRSVLAIVHRAKGSYAVSMEFAWRSSDSAHCVSGSDSHAKLYVNFLTLEIRPFPDISSIFRGKHRFLCLGSPPRAYIVDASCLVLIPFQVAVDLLFHEFRIPISTIQYNEPACSILMTSFWCSDCVRVQIWFRVSYEFHRNHIIHG